MLSSAGTGQRSSRRRRSSAPPCRMSSDEVCCMARSPTVAPSARARRAQKARPPQLLHLSGNFGSGGRTRSPEINPLTSQDFRAGARVQLCLVSGIVPYLVPVRKRKPRLRRHRHFRSRIGLPVAPPPPRPPAGSSPARRSGTDAHPSRTPAEPDGGVRVGGDGWSPADAAGSAVPRAVGCARGSDAARGFLHAKPRRGATCACQATPRTELDARSGRPLPMWKGTSEPATKCA